MSDARQTPCPDWPRVLLGVLERQRSLVGELADLSRRQSALVGSSSMDALLSVLGERQQVIDRFVATQDELAGLLEGLDQRLKTAPDQDRRRITALIGEIGRALADVMRCDEQDQEALASDRDRTRSELTSLGASRQARRAYRNARAVNNRFADRRG